MRYLIILSLITLAHSLSKAQITVKHIENYGPQVTQAGKSIQAVTANADGILFFASDKGVLIYDGESWQTILLNQQLSASAVEYDAAKNMIWVGGLGTFGYLRQEAPLRFKYISLSEKLYNQKPFNEVWDILISKDSVSFISYEGHFVYKNNQVTRHDVEKTLIYDLDDIRYLSRRNGKTTIQRKHRATLKNQLGSIFKVTRLDANHHLLYTLDKGIFTHQLSTGKISPYSSPINKLLKQYEFYTCINLNDSIVAIGTKKNGILIADLRGNLLETINVTNGLISDWVYDFELGPMGKLWVTTDYGISLINLKEAMPTLAVANVRKLKTIIKLVRYDSIAYFPASTDTLLFHKKPDYLRIRYTTPGIEFSSNHEYLIRLNGYDTTWRDTPFHDFAEYYKLPNGNYQFQVKQKVGSAETQMASFYFTINEPWYSPLQEIWPSILIALICITVIVLSIVYRVRLARKKLTELVEAKTFEVKIHEQELIKLNQSLVETNAELDSLLYRSSHDLISPVKSVQGLLELMKMSEEKSEQEHYMHLMQDRIKRLEKIISEISMYVKSAKGKPIQKPFFLKELVNEVWAELEFLEGAYRITFAADIEDTFEIQSDRDRWKIVLSNLITNAIKYHDQKKEDPFIKISVIKEDQTIKVLVSDNGQGIEPKYQDRLFEMFYRATDASQGTGLGLFLVKKVVDSLRGTIQLQSDFKVGTRVEIAIPLAA